MLDSSDHIEDRRLRAALLRQSVRDIDLEIERIQTDKRLFMRCGFGSEIKEIQLTALLAQREDLTSQLSALVDSSPRRARRAPITSWLLIPSALGALLLQTVRPRTARRSLRRARLVPDSEIGF